MANTGCLRLQPAVPTTIDLCRVEMSVAGSVDTWLVGVEVLMAAIS